MIATSSAWREVQNHTLLPEVFVEITYEITEPGLQRDASASVNHQEDFSDVTQIVSPVSGVSEKYATLDYGCFGLDGTFSFSDETPSNPGYVDSNYSDENSVLASTQYPKITIDFSKRHFVLIPGITITWSKTFGAWATDFTVSAYNSSGLVTRKTVRGNKSVVSVVELDLYDYSQIIVEVLGWSHPYHRVRCSDILLGIQTVYTKEDLLGYDHTQSIDILSAKLPDYEVGFRLRNDDGRWNPDIPEGMEKYLLEQQEIRVRYGMDLDGDVEWIDGGTFWLSEWDTPTSGLEVDFTARGAVEFMFGSYSGPRVGTLYDVAVAAFEEADLPVLDDGSARYVVDESLKNINTNFEDDGSVYTISEILQMVAHAGCCVFHQDRKGVVRIEPRNMNYSGYMIEPTICYTHPEYTMSKPLKAIEVDYDPDEKVVSIEVASRGEIQTINNPLILGEENARRVGLTAKEILQNRKEISGSFRADLRLDALDNIFVVSKYASNVLCVTELEYSFSGGAFKGDYTGRVVAIDSKPVEVYSNEFYSGEIW